MSMYARQERNNLSAIGPPIILTGTMARREELHLK